MNGDLTRIENGFWSSLDLIFDEGDVAYETHKADEFLRRAAEVNDFSTEDMDTFIKEQAKRRSILLKKRAQEEKSAREEKIRKQAERQKIRAEKFPQEGSW